MSSYLLGAKVLKRLCVEQSPLAYHEAKLSPTLFVGEQELAVYGFVRDHVTSFHVLPAPATLEAQFPELAELDTPEPVAYYAKLLDTRFAYNTLKTAAIGVNDTLKANATHTDQAEAKLRDALSRLTEQKYRAKIMDVGLEAAPLVINKYHGNLYANRPAAQFGWPWMDDAGGVEGGEVASFVGRPAMGKSFQMLYVGIHNWRKLNLNTLFVSMEMPNLEIAQRITSMYAGLPIGQLKKGAFSSIVFESFDKKVEAMKHEPAKFYSVDGNLAVNVEAIYSLAAILNCKVVIIDGAYMVRSSNPRLDRYTKVAENVETMKRLSSVDDVSTFASWQFAKTAVTKKKMKGVKEGLEDIGYSDAIGQISSIVIAATQEDNVETLDKRKLSVIKGRSGHTGEFYVRWNFDTMDFNQVDLPPDDVEPPELDYV